jgi:hypothetical protein
VERAAPVTFVPSAVFGTVVAIAILFVTGSLVFGSGISESLSALITASVLVAVSLPILSREAIRQGDTRLMWFLVAALLLKLLGAVLRFHLSYDLYERADATGYHEYGSELAAQFRLGNFDTGLDLVGTNFIRFFTGVVYAVIGPSMLGGFVFYSWLGFWGLFYFYRAFAVALPEASTRSYRRLLFFLPSLLFWPSSIGKEAWMMFALGIAALGAARILSGTTLRGFAIAGTGLWLTAMVRPHVAGLMGLALVGAYVFKPPKQQLRELGPVAKMLSLAVLVAVAGILVLKTDQFLKGEGIDTGGGVRSTLQQTAERTSAGESEFSPSILESPARAPIAVATVLFRPFIFEAHNTQSLVAAVEGSLLVLLSLIRLPWFFAAVRRVRESPYIAFAVAYVAMFIVAFSSFSNFGILARERVQLFPLYLVLFSIPRRKREGEDASKLHRP